MFLQYALWGAWLPVTARYLSASISDGGLGFSGSQIGMILGLAGSIGAIAAPFIAGQIADRYFSTCLLYTSPSPRDVEESRMPSSA